uniref:Uncharacterized protein n=1 Tax=Clytia hemisphaerica TaxID=252671 RepID=A0A7M5X3S8_9CNID
MGEITPKEIIKLLEGCINFLNIDVKNEISSSSILMDIEDQVDKMNYAITKLNNMPSFEKPSKEVEKPQRKGFSQPSRTDIKDVTSPTLTSPPAQQQQQSPVPQSPIITPTPTPITQDDMYEDPSQTTNKNSDLPPPPPQLTQDDFYEEAPGSAIKDKAADEISNTSSDQSLSITSNDTEDRMKTLKSSSAEEMKAKAIFYGTIRKNKRSLLSLRWKKRFCVLLDSLLLYYETETDKEAMGIIDLATGYRLNVPAKGNGFLFHLEHPDKNQSSYTFQADSLQHAEQWRKHLAAVIETTNEGFVNDAFNQNAPGSSSSGSAENSGSAMVTDIVDAPPTNVSGGDMGGDDFYDDIMNHVNNKPVIQPTIDTAPKPLNQQGNTEGAQGEEIYDDVVQPTEQDDGGEIYDDVSNQVQTPTPAVRPQPPTPMGGITHTSPQLMNSPALIASRPPLVPPTPLAPPTPTDQYSIDNIYMGIYDCESEGDQDLAFNRGDVMYILEKVHVDWWLAYLEGKVGLVPSNHLTTAFVN